MNRPVGRPRGPIRNLQSRPSFPPSVFQNLSFADGILLFLDGDAGLHALGHVLGIQTPFSVLGPLFAQHGVVGDELVEVGDAVEHSVANADMVIVVAAVGGTSSFLQEGMVESAFVRKGFANLPHLVNPAVGFGGHPGETSLDEGESVRAEFLQMGLQLREDAAGVGGGEGQDGQRGEAFGEGREARFEGRGRTDGVGDHFRVEEREEGRGQEVGVPRAGNDERGPFPGLVVMERRRAADDATVEEVDGDRLHWLQLSVAVDLGLGLVEGKGFGERQPPGAGNTGRTRRRVLCIDQGRDSRGRARGNGIQVNVCQARGCVSQLSTCGAFASLPDGIGRSGGDDGSSGRGDGIARRDDAQDDVGLGHESLIGGEDGDLRGFDAV